MFNSLLLKKTFSRVNLCNRFFETVITNLKNGISVAVEETHSPYVCTSLFVETGPRFETVYNNGITHFIEHMAYKGFQNMSKDHLEQLVYEMGAQLTVETNREFQIFTAKCNPEHATSIVDILCQIPLFLEFDTTEIQVAKENILQESMDSDNSPVRVVFDYLHQAAFQGTPLAQRVIGSTKNIENFECKDAYCFMRENYTPRNMVVAISGAVTNSEITSYVQKRFSHIPSDSVCEKIRDYGSTRYTGSSVIYRDDSMPLAYVAIGLEAPGYDHSDYMALFVANCIMGSWDKSQGGTDRHAAYLARASSTRDLCEFYKPFYIVYRDVGLWGVYFAAPKMDLDDFVYNLQEAWMRLCTIATQADLERGVNLAKLKLAKSVDNAVGSSYDMGVQILYTGGRISLREKYDKLDKINIDAFRDICYKYIYDTCPVVSATGPTESLPDYTRLRAGMYWLRH